MVRNKPDLDRAIVSFLDENPASRRRDVCRGLGINPIPCERALRRLLRNGDIITWKNGRRRHYATRFYARPKEASDVAYN